MIFFYIEFDYVKNMIIKKRKKEKFKNLSILKNVILKNIVIKKFFKIYYLIYLIIFV